MSNEVVRCVLDCAALSIDSKATDLAYDQILKALQDSVERNPYSYLEEIKSAVETKEVYLAPFCMVVAVTSGSCDGEDSVELIRYILGCFDSAQLLEFVELLKSKVFRKGLGSRYQKIVRSVIEAWPVERLQFMIEHFGVQTYDLVRLIHPRLKGYRGTLVRKILTS